MRASRPRPTSSAARRWCRSAAASPATSTPISRRPRARTARTSRGSARRSPRIPTARPGSTAGCASRPATTRKTIMPNVLLEPVTLADGTVSDPAADAVGLPASTSTEELEADRHSRRPARSRPTSGRRLEELALDVPQGALSGGPRRGGAEERARRRAGDDPGRRADAAGHERPREPRCRRCSNYVGKKTIAKLACYSCHDIPGFEDGKAAGAALADWGRKEPSKIAFEQVVALRDAPARARARHGHGGGHPAVMRHESRRPPPTSAGSAADEPARPRPRLRVRGRGAHVDPESVDPDTGFFLEKLLGHEREGFLWQKLRPAAELRLQEGREQVATTSGTACRSSRSTTSSGRR